MEKLFISIDPGCDAFKVVINKKVFRIPSNVEEVVLKDVRNLINTDKPEKYIICNKNSTNYAIGELAKAHMAASKNVENYKGGLKDTQNKKVNDGQEYFLSEEFLIGAESMIGYGMNLFAEETGIVLEELQKREIYCSIALPHGAVNEYSEPVMSKISGHHEYKLTIGHGKEILFNYTIEKKNTFIMSQVISAIMSELLDDNGIPLPDITINKFPTLVLDGGYRTLGIVNVRADFFIDDRESESNEDYAMVKVNERVSNIIKEKYGVDMPEYMVEQYMEKEEYEQKYRTDTGKFAIFNLKDIKDNEMEKVVRECVGYLDKKYSELLENKGILITGGTGTAYHKYLKDIFVKEREQFKEEEIALTSTPFNGEPCDAVFAIAVGNYKAMLTAVNN